MWRFLILLIGAALVAGCTTKARSRAEAQAAFTTGQQQAFWQMQLQQEQARSVRVMGDVRNPMINWAEGLTLSQAIVAAEFRPLRTPRVIIVHRQGQPHQVDPKQLLRGDDFLVEAGDVIEIRQ